jgi:hypothetical protein
MMWSAAFLLVWQPSASAQDADASKHQIVDVDISNWRSRRNVSLITASGQTINRLAEIALDGLVGAPTGTRWTMWFRQRASILLCFRLLLSHSWLSMKRGILYDAVKSVGR